MGFRISSSIIVATVILAGVAGYMATGDVVRGGIDDPSIPTIAERNENTDAQAFTVRTVTVQPQQRLNALDIRGRTKAESVIPIRAETAGTVQERLVAKGQRVEPGMLVCRLDPGTRESSIAEAEAAVTQARFDLDANEKLLQRGFATESQVQGLRAGLNRAQAQLDAARKELERTEIVATVGGIVQDPVAEVGDNLAAGGACVTLVDLDPMLLTAQVGEQDIFKIQEGQTAEIELITGDKHIGQVSFVGASADARTRTFTVDIRLPNPEGKILDGISADGRIELASDMAYLIKPSWLVLADDGAIGLRMVDEQSQVQFAPVDIIEQTRDGFWVSGLEAGTEVITLGQDFVTVGETVRTAPEGAEAEDLAVAPDLQSKQLVAENLQ